jgi:thiamine-monophosphate kinase
VGTLLGPGDDSAVVAAPDGRLTVTTDILLDGVHFRDAWSTGFDVGWRLAAQNLADAAAMGAVPRFLVVALAGPPERLAGPWASDFACGLSDYCRHWGTGVVGGDLAAGPVLVASGTALGDLEGRPAVTRGGAQVGDSVALSATGAAAPGVSGDARPVPGGPAHWALGGSAGGLAWLESQASGQGDAVGGQTAGAAGDRSGDGVTDGLADGLAQAAVAAYLRPDPLLGLGKDAALAGATAMMDVSDGLGKDASRLAVASGVRLSIDPGCPALDGPRRHWAPLARALGCDPCDWVLGGGEDHAFLATFPAGASLPDGWGVIGQVLAPGPDGPGVTFRGARSQESGWDHFA